MLNVYMMNMMKMNVYITIIQLNIGSGLYLMRLRVLRPQLGNAVLLFTSDVTGAIGTPRNSVTLGLILLLPPSSVNNVSLDT